VQTRISLRLATSFMNNPGYAKSYMVITLPQPPYLISLQSDMSFGNHVAPRDAGRGAKARFSLTTFRVNFYNTAEGNTHSISRDRR